MAPALRSSVVGAAVDAYDRHVGRYGRELAQGMIAAGGIREGQRALDVGCGTGALAVELGAALGAPNVSAIDPSERFAAACRGRLPGADVRVGVAEQLPWADAEFDAVLAQLVVDGMNDAAKGVGEMRRVARPGGVVVACVWDFVDRMPLLGAVWSAAREIDAELARSLGSERRNPYSRPEELDGLWRSVGLTEVRVTRIEAGADYTDFEDLWYPFAHGVGNLGRFHAALDQGGRDRFRRAAAKRLGSPKGPFRLTATAWCVRGTAA